MLATIALLTKLNFKVFPSGSVALAVKFNVSPKVTD